MIEVEQPDLERDCFELNRRGCWLTSPRLRGEVGLLRAMQSIVRSNPGEGESPRTPMSGICGSSPSPQPSKSELRSSRPRKSGAREQTAILS